jgi:hypothetical protein
MKSSNRRIHMADPETGRSGDERRVPKRRTRIVTFPEAVIAAMGTTLPPNTDPARLALLPQILRAWADEDLLDHLSREGRADLRRREKQLRKVGGLTRDLIEAISLLDQHGRFEIALNPQMRRARTSLWNTDVAAGEERRDNAISWLIDLDETFNDGGNGSENGQRPPPDTATRYYLIILDLAGIFELVSQQPPTRRVNPDSGRTYGPFADFVAQVWAQIFSQNRGLSYAIRVWSDEMARERKLAETEVARAAAKLSRPLSDAERDAIESRFLESSMFVANLQFRHSLLWRKLRRT